MFLSSDAAQICDIFCLGKAPEARAEARAGREGVVREEAGEGQRPLHGVERLEAAAGEWDRPFHV